MCGIAGFIARDDETATVDEVRRMTNTIVHRGPDEEGISAQRRVGLGIRRLNIIDLSGGSHPIYNAEVTRSTTKTAALRWSSMARSIKLSRVAQGAGGERAQVFYIRLASVPHVLPCLFYSSGRF